MADPTIKVDPLTLELLDHRMRNSKLPSKPSQSFDTKQFLNISDSFDTGKIIPEVPKNLYTSNLLSSIENPHVDDHLSPSDKENSKGFISIEPGNKLTGPLPDLKTDTTDLSYQSSNHRGSRSIKKRKYETFEKPGQAIDTKPEQTYELATKRTKLTLPQAPTGNPNAMIPENVIKGDSNGSANEMDHDYKEIPLTSLGSKKITDYYVKSTTIPSENKTEKAYTKATGRGKKQVAAAEKKVVEKEVHEVKESNESSKELYTRIKDLEDKLEGSKKDRERDNIKHANEVLHVQETYEKYKSKVHKILARHELDLENHKRNERKTQLNQQKQRLGEYVSQREGSKFVDIWCDGSDIRSVKEKLETIMKEREELEKQKKNIKSKKVSGSVVSKQASLVSDTQLTLPSGMVSYMNTENSVSNSVEMDLKETKERISAKITMLQREENILREELERLEVEKTIFYQQFKKQYEEDHSRYGRPNSDTNAPAWPILSERYQLLSLLGKGGFSEVYKAYDLEELGPVACKVHQLNPNWTENAKTNYVKHANREFEVHKELNHPNIVRLFDCINIDDHSFATVLEYCEGPDLSFYLKQHKSLPEKDAKVIVKQILAGLKYLSDHKTKIIHYDLKPQNVMFHKGEVKISDFGLCKIVDSDASRIELTSQGVGTYWYLPPECFIMEDQPPMINNKVDVWSLAIIYFEMLFGMKPFGNNMSQEKILKEQVILKSFNVNFPSKPQISNETKDFIKKCLAYNQDDRIDIYEAYDIMYNGKK